jgi:16S rRNA (guanine527-N7)-methyltransferase
MPSAAETAAHRTPAAPAASPPQLRREFDAGLAEMGSAIADVLDAEARDRLIAFILLLERWNRRFNLTAVRAPTAMIPRHLLDSLALLPRVTAGPVLDLGTGAGLPGIPLAVARPELTFTLLDANGKKVRFVRQAALELGLGNIAPTQGRIETYRPEEKFVTIVSRAVAPSDFLWRCARPLLADCGRLLAMKGRRPPDDELERLSALQGRRNTATDGAGHPECRPPGAQLHIRRLRVPLLDGERHLIDIPLDAQAHG